MAKSMGKSKFRPQRLRNGLIDFDEIQTLELSPEGHPPCKISFRSDDVGAWFQRIPSLPLSLKRQFPMSMFPQVVQKY